MNDTCIVIGDAQVRIAAPDTATATIIISTIVIRFTAIAREIFR